MDPSEPPTPELQPAQLKSITIGFTIFFAFFMLYTWLTAPTPLSTFHDSQPCPGLPSDISFPWLIATLKSYKNTASLVHEGYVKFSKQNETFIVPNVTKGPVLIVPPKQLSTVLSQPETEVEVLGPRLEQIQAWYTVGDKDVFPGCEKVDLMRLVTEKFGLVIEEVADEARCALEEEWGMDREWRDVKARRSIGRIVVRALNRALLGKELCRDQKLMDALLRYSDMLRKNGNMINVLPKGLRPVLGPLIVALNGKTEFNYCVEVIALVIKQRLEDLKKKENELDFKWDPLCDGIQWVIQASQASGDPSQLQAQRMAHRLIMLNFESILPISIAITNTIFDLFSSSPAEDFVNTLRNECDSVLTQSKGRWTKEAIKKMHYLDSAIRESMRLSPFSNFGYLRQIASPDGVMLEDRTLIPQGVKLAVPVRDIQRDDEHYPSASKFLPFRFCKSDSASRSDWEKEKKSMVDIDDTFLSWGYGKNACPGRFMAADQMKLVVAQVLKYYEVEHIRERLTVNHVMEFQYPDEKTIVRVRRRNGA